MKKLLTLALTALVTAPAGANDDISNELTLVENWLASQRAYDNVPGLSAPS